MTPPPVATSETTGKGGDHGGREGTKKAVETFTEATETEAHHRGRGTGDHARKYVARSNCTRVVKAENHLIA